MSKLKNKILKNTRKVYYDGKTYVLEVDGYNVKKITPVKK